MKVMRFSAVGNFGVPIDNPNLDLEQNRILHLMTAYSIEGQEISPEPTDITPYYWKRPAFRYRLSRREEYGPAVVRIIPTHDDSSAHIVGSMASGTMFSVESHIRTMEIPTDQKMLMIGGPGPRFIGQLCIHELIASV